MNKLFLSFVLLAGAVLSHAQEFPKQQIRIVIPYAAGGGNDLLARPVGLHMAERLKQPVVIENKPGAAGNIGAQAVAQANPDGHTLLMANISHTINPFIYKNPGYDMANFAPISLLGTSPTIMVVHNSIPATTLVEFVAYAKKNSRKLNFGSAGVGTPPHLAALLFSKLTDISLVHIPYKGSAQLAMALLQKEIDVVFATPPAVAAYIKSGEFRALAVTSLERIQSYPNVPTVAESGLPGLGDFQIEVWWGLVAPVRTNPRVLDTLHAAVIAAIQDPKLSERWLADGVVATTNSRAEFQARIKSDQQKWEKVVRENAITVE